MAFEATLVDSALALRDEITCVEEDGMPFVARWIPASRFRDGSAPLYPEGLLALVEQAGLADA